MRALVWIAVINGIVAVPVMTLLMLPIQGAFAGARARQIRQGVAQRSLQSKLGRRKPDRLGTRVWRGEDRVIRLSMQIKVMVMESWRRQWGGHPRRQRLTPSVALARSGAR